MRSETRAVIAACLFGGAICSPGNADTVVFDNSDLAFTPTPYQYSFGPPYQFYGPPDYIFVNHSPADNQAGLGAGPSFFINLGRTPFSSSVNVFDFFTAPYPHLAGGKRDIYFALRPDTIQLDASGSDMHTVQPLVELQEGDTVSLFDFAEPLDNFVVHGPTAEYTEGGGPVGLVPLLGDGAILGWRADAEGGGFWYGWVRVEFFEDIPFERASGGTDLVDLYLPTAWGYADTVDEPALVSLPAPCPADFDGSGTLNIDDIDAFVAAFIASDVIADFDGSGTLNIDDIDAFVAAFLAGC